MTNWTKLMSKLSDFYWNYPSLASEVATSDRGIKELIESDEKEEIEQLESKVQGLRQENGVLKSDIKELQEELSEYELPDKANYWNNKYPKKQIAYRRPLLGGENHWIDVRLFIQPNDYEIINRIKKNDLIVNDPMKINDIVPDIYGEAQKDYNYSYDSKSLGRSEYWLFPWETLAIDGADCEDHSHKIVSFLRAAGVPSWRIRVVCGIINSGGAGHSTVYVLGDDMETWYHINSTSTEVKDNLSDYPEWGDKSDGIGIDPNKCWFTFNDKYAWQEFESDSSKTEFEEHNISDIIEVKESE